MSPVLIARLSGLVVASFGVVACILARRLPAQTGFGLGPAFLPFWTGIVLAACGLWLCARRQSHESVHGSTGSPRTDDHTARIDDLTVRPELVEGRTGDWDTIAVDADVSWPGSRGCARAASGFLLLLLYALALQPLGYLVSTAVFLVVGMLLLEPLHRVRALLLGIGSTAFLLLIFRVWLRVPLPGGVLGW